MKRGSKISTLFYIMPNKIVIIAAGGSGARLKSDLPKQYHLLKGKPVLMHTIQAFVGIADRIIVVLSVQMTQTWQNLCSAHLFDIPHELVIGGDTRFQSVRNAIQHIKNTTPNPLDGSTVIAIHDAARPLVERKLISASFEMALAGNSNVLAVPSTDSIRIGDKLNSTSMDRSRVWQVQTPQSFPAPLLIEAFEQDEIPTFTDDASVVEQRGHTIHLLESSPRNIKLTYAEDFEIALSHLKNEL
ncbi:2-C-methyl-D-erythritol 4-phosphate cytidylyltransferase [Sphingobacterium nematocida]|uniref:2-C-methyl-D-erythritol 4-phosphate cytidylyltransferase n=2 Tax=Sphingobacterium nematocida TaxID=1513896 RepID=A0A1T5EI96_9SPHI|nr:2-C-methyl-D-erythritol 4-phosphate cytidylyltransferase [Sphingobacterium nematocida]